MSRTLSTPGLKPGLWNASYGLVAPDWRWFWDASLIAVAPLWEGGGDPRGWPAQITASRNANIVWQPAPDGPVLHWNNDGTQQDLIWAGVGDLESTGTYTISYRFLGVSGSFNFSYRAGFGLDGTDSFSLSIAADGELFAFTDGGNTQNTGGPVVDDGLWHTATVIWDQPAGTIDFWVDGILEHTVTSYGDTSSQTNTRLYARLDGTQDAGDPDWEISTIGVWKRAWGSGEIEQFALDPYGPFRMHRREAYLTTGGGGGGGAGLPPGVAAYHLNQLRK